MYNNERRRGLWGTVLQRGGGALGDRAPEEGALGLAGMAKGDGELEPQCRRILGKLMEFRGFRASLWL